MAEFSDYVESREHAETLDGTEKMAGSKGGEAMEWNTQQIADLAAATGGTFEFGRAWSSELLFDKNSIYYADHTQTGAINFTIAGAGNLVDEDSVIRQRITSDGTNTISFTGFNTDYIKGITSGDILPAGNYEFWFAYANGTVSVSVPGESASEVTASNAVNRNGDNIELGGAFTKNTSMDGNGWHLTLGANLNRLGNLRSWSDVAVFDAETAATVQVGASALNLTPTTISVGNASGDIAIGPTGLVVTDTTATPSGLRAAADYSPNYTSLNYVTKGDLDAAAVPDADETTKGIAERATDAEVITGTDTTRFTSPASVHAKVTGIQDFPITAAAMWPRITDGCSEITKFEMPTSLVNVMGLSFDQTTQEFAQVMCRFPKRYNLGTITAEVTWTAQSGSGGVVFGLSGGAYSNDDSLTTALGTEQTMADTLLDTNDIHITPTSAAITLAGTPAVADFIILQLSRNPANGSDTLNADAIVLNIVIHFTASAANDA